MRYDKVVQSYVKEAGEFTLASFMDRFEENDKEEAEEFLFSLVKKGILDYAPGFIYKYKGGVDPDNASFPMVYQAYFNQIQTMTKSNVCMELDLAVEDAEMLLESLMEQGLCEWDSEFVFRFTGKEGQAEPDAPSFTDFFHRNNNKKSEAGVKSFRARFEEQEMAEEQEQDDEEEDDLVKDDEEYDEEDFGRNDIYNKPLTLSRNLCEDVLARLQELNDTENGKGLSDEEGVEKLTLSVRKELLETALSLGGTECFEKTGDEYVWNVDIAYPDDSPMKFRLYYYGGVRISDNGLTMAFIRKYYDVTSDRVRLELERIFDEYAIEQEGDELFMRIESKQARLPMFFLFAAIEQVVNALSYNVLKAVENDIKERCADVMKQIIFGGGTEYAKAKAKVEALLSEAENSGSEEDKAVYRKVLDTLEDVTEENFDRFVERVIVDPE